jgi:hypothetical protein
MESENVHFLQATVLIKLMNSAMCREGFGRRFSLSLSWYCSSIYLERLVLRFATDPLKFLLGTHEYRSRVLVLQSCHYSVSATETTGECKERGPVFIFIPCYKDHCEYSSLFGSYESVMLGDTSCS